MPPPLYLSTINQTRKSTGKTIEPFRMATAVTNFQMENSRLGSFFRLGAGALGEASFGLLIRITDHSFMPWGSEWNKSEGWGTVNTISNSINEFARPSTNNHNESQPHKCFIFNPEPLSTKI